MGQLKYKDQLIVKDFTQKKITFKVKLFIKFSHNGKFATLIVQVDNIIFTEDDIDEMGRVKEKLAANFKIKDLEFQRYFLGIEIVNQKRESY